MNTIEKARAAASPAERARTEAGGALVSCEYDTTQGRGLQAPIADLLPHGSKAAISTRELMTLTGYASARQLQKQIEAERAAGALILSSSTGGYYLPADGEDGRAEIIRYERTLRRRAVSIFRTLQAARQVLAQTQIEGQEVMGDE